jgi:hypothetical protein
MKQETIDILELFAQFNVLETEFSIVKAKKGKDYLYAIFTDTQSKNDYLLKDYDSESFIIWENEQPANNKKTYGYSRTVYTQGVRMRWDGTGEPDSYEWEESTVEFPTIYDACIGIIHELRENKNTQFNIDLGRLIVEVMDVEDNN